MIRGSAQEDVGKGGRLAWTPEIPDRFAAEGGSGAVRQCSITSMSPSLRVCSRRGARVDVDGAHPLTE
ncbi:MAG: hypothetical protein AVDCRST_MAG56-5572 [uncultured Cytophagales bacterium]|uniref:Uncharacterized protein n=1 Tax=uncultured Cytophagales bacterium TaxID=158755 RepID=A0A6J4KE48_9SPHI|nr:MAG: hypothetical protein AVDCRST_MAG56-5572 [uncultured Cytophagales bacterium]